MGKPGRPTTQHLRQLNSEINWQSHHGQEKADSTVVSYLANKDLIPQLKICMYYILGIYYVLSPRWNLESSYPFFKTQLKVAFSMTLVAHASTFFHDIKTHLLCIYIYIIVYLIIVLC